MSILRASACRTSCPRCFDMNKTELKNAAIDSIESMADFYEKTADEIWENPELSLKEYKAAALMTETSFERVFIDGTAELLPNFTLEKLMYDNFEKIGVVQHNDEERAFAAELRKTFPPQSAVPGIGAHFNADIAETVMEKTHDLTEPLNDFLMPYYSGTGFTAGSTDVGDVSWLTPAAQIETATWPSGMPLHTWQTVACGKSSIAYKGMLCAGKVMAASAIDLIEDPELLKAAREEFKRRAKGGYTCPIEPETVPTAL